MRSDYEIAILTAVTAKLPDDRARECYFHQSQVQKKCFAKMENFSYI